MGLWTDHVVPRLVHSGLDHDDVREIRARVCADLSGEIVAVGFGSGLDAPFLPAAVTRVHAVDPSRLARRMASDAIAASPAEIVFDGDDGQRLPYADASLDGALVTFTLCSIRDPGAAARELRRVLRPGAPVAFAEHGLHPDPVVARRQGRLEPLQRRLVGGCHFTRRAPDIFEAAGFEVDLRRAAPMPGMPAVAGYIYEGVAFRSS